MRRSYDAFDIIAEVVVGVMLMYVFYVVGSNIVDAVTILMEYGVL